MLKIIQQLNYKIKILVCILLFILIILLIIYLINTKNNYEIRISIKQENLSAQKMDDIFGINLINEFLKNKNLKTVISISSKNYCNFYLKFNLFSNKTSQIQKTKIVLEDFLTRVNLNPEIDFDFNYNKKYTHFLIFYSDILSLNDLVYYSDVAYDKLKTLKYVSKILDFQKYQTTDYIYFKNSDLLTYDITPTEIKNLIKTNNTNENSSVFENSNSYNIIYNSDIKNINDIGNIVLYYQNEDFSNELKNIFKIEESANTPEDFSVFFDNKKVKLFALSKNPFVFGFVFDFLISKEMKNLNSKGLVKYKLINASNLSKIEINTNDNSSIHNLEEIIRNISENFSNQIYFLKTDPPKTSSKDIFLETNKNKITILTKKKNALKNYLEKNKIPYLKQNPNSKKEKAIFYNLDSTDINNYFLDKKVLIESILANNEGLICDYYFRGSNRIKIIFKNGEKNDYVYSKNHKILLNLTSFSKKELKEEYSVIFRKNGKKM